jgi:hypothetical protein
VKFWLKFLDFWIQALCVSDHKSPD